MNRYKVMVRMEDRDPDGKLCARVVCVRRDVPRGTAEALAIQYMRDGFRLDADRGTSYYPSHRIILLEVCVDEEGVH